MYGIVCDTHHKGAKEMSKEEETEEIIDNWKKQLRKGTLELAILAYIKKMNGKSYGYILIKTLNDVGIQTDGSTIYPLLRRLIKKGLIDAVEKEEDNKKYFKINDTGIRVLKELKEEWNDYYKIIEQLIENGGK